MSKMSEAIRLGGKSDAEVVRGGGIEEVVSLHGRFEIACHGPDGQLKWKDSIDNLVTTVGKNSVLDKFLDLGAAHSAIHLGLKGTGAAAIGNTMGSHAPWLEVGLANAPTYTGNRKVPAFSAASSASKVMSAAAAFAITSTGTVSGCFIVMSGSATKDDTTGTLYSAGDFTQGDKAVSNGDTLNVTYTATA